MAILIRCAEPTLRMTGCEKVGRLMIHLFNRRELVLTPSMEEVIRIRSMLEANRIEYTVKTKTTLVSSSVRHGRPGNIPGVNQNTTAMYAVYVRREDLEYAAHLL